MPNLGFQVLATTCVGAALTLRRTLQFPPSGHMTSELIYFCLVIFLLTSVHLTFCNIYMGCKILCG
jgi:hypothetical protein